MKRVARCRACVSWGYRCVFVFFVFGRFRVNPENESEETRARWHARPDAHTENVKHELYNEARRLLSNVCVISGSEETRERWHARPDAHKKR